MAKHLFQVHCELPVHMVNLDGISGGLEVQLPCSSCKKCDRTMVYESLGSEGCCTPFSSCAGKMGRWIQTRFLETKNGILLQYDLQLEFEAFRDSRYGRLCTLEASHWARVNFRLQCSCGTKTTLSTQDNLVRPRTEYCACGALLYQEKENPLSYRTFEMLPP